MKVIKPLLQHFTICSVNELKNTAFIVSTIVNMINVCFDFIDVKLTDEYDCFHRRFVRVHRIGRVDL